MFIRVHRAADRPHGAMPSAVRRGDGARARAAIALLPLVVLVLGCGRESPARDVREMGSAARATGIWDAEFRIERSPAGPKRGRSAVARGTMALMPTDRDIGREWLQRTTTHTGIFDVDFRPLGFVPAATGPVQTLVAAAAEPDTLVVVTPAGPDGGMLAMHGSVAATGDSVAGTWTYATRAVGGWGGSFSLHRTSRER